MLAVLLVSAIAAQVVGQDVIQSAFLRFDSFVQPPDSFAAVNPKKTTYDECLQACKNSRLPNALVVFIPSPVSSLRFFACRGSDRE